MKKNTLERVYSEKAAAELAAGINNSPNQLNNKDKWIIKNVGPGNSVLDIGSGLGRLGSGLQRSFEHVYGIDVSEECLAACLQNGYEEAKICDLSDQDIPYDDGVFDAAICLETLEHLIDPVYTLSQINRVLADGGRVGITCPNVGFLLCRIFMAFGHFTDLRDIDQPPLHLRFFTYKTMKLILQRTGFKIKSIGGFPATNDTNWLSFLYGLSVLSNVAPGMFSPSIVLVAEKIGPPAVTEWVAPPHVKLAGVKWIKRLWKVT